MPTVDWRIECDYCNSELHEELVSSFPDLDDHIGTCTHCGEDVCKKCKASGEEEDDLTMHKECKKELEGLDDESPEEV